LAFADCGLEFLLDLGLRLAQHVLDDALSGFLIIKEWTGSAQKLP